MKTREVIEMSRKTIIYAVPLFLFAGLVTPAVAQDNGEFARFNDPFRFYMGAFSPTLRSEVTINGDNVTPPPIDLEDALGVSDSDTVLWGGFQWIISQRNSIELEFFQLNRSGFVDLFPDPVAVGDLIIESGSINSAFDLGVTRVTYGFSLKRSKRVNLRLKGGLHIANFSTGLQLQGAVCDVGLGQMPPGCPVAQTPPLESEDVTAPLPHFGVSYSYAINEKVEARFQVLAFAIEINNIDGSLLELDADIDWKPWRNFGFGLAFRYFDVNVEAKGSNLNGEFDLEYYGPAVYVAGSF
jgi:hypothetical protein